MKRTTTAAREQPQTKRAAPTAHAVGLLDLGDHLLMVLLHILACSNPTSAAMLAATCRRLRSLSRANFVWRYAPLWRLSARRAALLPPHIAPARQMFFSAVRYDVGGFGALSASVRNDLRALSLSLPSPPLSADDEEIYKANDDEDDIERCVRLCGGWRLRPEAISALSGTLAPLWEEFHSLQLLDVRGCPSALCGTEIPPTVREARFSCCRSCADSIVPLFRAGGNSWRQLESLSIRSSAHFFGFPSIVNACPGLRKLSLFFERGSFGKYELGVLWQRLPMLEDLDLHFHTKVFSKASCDFLQFLPDSPCKTRLRRLAIHLYDFIAPMLVSEHNLDMSCVSMNCPNLEELRISGFEDGATRLDILVRLPKLSKLSVVLNTPQNRLAYELETQVYSDDDLDEYDRMRFGEDIFQGDEEEEEDGEATKADGKEAAEAEGGQEAPADSEQEESEDKEEEDRDETDEEEKEKILAKIKKGRIERLVTDGNRKIISELTTLFSATFAVPFVELSLFETNKIDFGSLFALPRCRKLERFEFDSYLGEEELDALCAHACATIRFLALYGIDEKTAALIQECPRLEKVTLLGRDPFEFISDVSEPFQLRFLEIKGALEDRHLDIIANSSFASFLEVLVAENFDCLFSASAVEALARACPHLHRISVAWINGAAFPALPPHVVFEPVYRYCRS